MNSAKDVGQFLRHDLAPLIAKHNCAVVIIHHTNKISRDPEKQLVDPAYLGLAALNGSTGVVARWPCVKPMWTIYTN